MNLKEVHSEEIGLCDCCLNKKAEYIWIGQNFFRTRIMLLCEKCFYKLKNNKNKKPVYLEKLSKQTGGNK